MRLSARQDVEAPAAKVFGRVSDFDTFARQAMRRGADVRRKAPDGPVGPGAGWDVRFTWRGRERHLQPVVTVWEPPSGFTLRSIGGGLIAVCNVDLVALTPARTRLVLSLDVQGANLGARLLVQSMRLAQASLRQRLNARLAAFCTTIDGVRRS